MLSRDARWLAAAVQVVIAWEWLVSGTNKVIAGTFPQGLADRLNEGLKGNPNDWYVALIQNIVLPHSVAFGFLIEVAEVLVGIALVVGAVVLIGPVRRRGTPQYRLALGEIGAATVAAALCIFLCVNFHFLMGDGIIPWFDPTRAFDEGISLDTLMPPMAVIILLFNIRLLIDMTEAPVGPYVARGWQQLRARFGGSQQSSPNVTESASPVA